MRGVWILGTLLCGAIAARGQTRLAEVLEVDPGARQVELRWMGGDADGPTRLRVPPARIGSLKRGDRGRVVVQAYGEENWLEHWWPVAPGSVGTLTSERWWREVSRGAGEGPPGGGVLGLDMAGELVRWEAAEHRLGFFVVPFVADGETAPGALAQVARLRARLHTTEYRDLLWILLSLDPKTDPGVMRAWQDATFGTAAEGLRWVSGLEEGAPSWGRFLGFTVHSVPGQAPVDLPVLLAVDPRGTLALRYEGWEWPVARLEHALDRAFRGPEPEGPE